MDVKTLLRDQIKQAHEWFAATSADITQEQLRWIPPGVANPLGAIYAHAITAEDALVHGMFKGEKPLFETTFATKTGISEPQLHAELEWARRVQVDLPLLRRYTEAVYASTDAYLASLTDAELSRLVPGPLGDAPISWALSNLVLAHIHEMMGEMSCLKGLQGAKGYPF
jgi:hypothetical protein